MNKLLVICGPTATGKTALAIHLAKMFNGEIISADSRQVYKYMDVGTGKDIPQGFKIYYSKFKKRVYYSNGKEKIWGYDIVDPRERFSVAQYERVGREVIKDILAREKLPIMVGGTGLYIKALLTGIETSWISPDFQLRKNLANKSVSELYEILFKVSPLKAKAMNESDRKNSRRLVRAIEIARHNAKEQKAKKVKKEIYDSLLIGLRMDKEHLNKKIEERVRKRVEQGIEGEIKWLLERGVSWEDQSMQAIGYRQWKSYFEKDEVGSKKEVIKRWIRAEKNYAKRQIAWFKKNPRIHWFDVLVPNFESRVEELIEKWYKK